LIDAGNQSTYKSQILPGLIKNGANVDTLIASHADINHIQGLTQALTDFPIKQILIPKGGSRSTAHTKLKSEANRLGIKIITATENSFPIDQSIHLEIIHAPNENLPLADDRCLNFILHWHDKRILFINDAGHHFSHWVRATQGQHDDKQLKPHVLIMGKHSNDSSIHPEIIEALSPQTIIATQTYYPAEQSRSNKWIYEIQKQPLSLYLLNETGAVTITLKDDNLRFNTVLEN